MRVVHTRRWSAVVAAAGLVASLSADTVTLVSDRDNTLYADPSGGLSNGAGEYFFVGRTGGGGVRRGLIHFSLAGQVPRGSTILSVELFLNVSRAATAEPLPVALHRALASWGEGASNAGERSGGGTLAAPGDATWLHRFYPADPWTHEGGDFVAAPSQVALVGFGPAAWPSSPELIADVADWANRPQHNHGWLLAGVESDLSAKRFDTRESIVDAHKPRLVVTFVAPPHCPGDFDDSRGVALSDAVVLLANLGTAAGAQFADGDCDGDGDVDMADVAQFQTEFALSCP